MKRKSLDNSIPDFDDAGGYSSVTIGRTRETYTARRPVGSGNPQRVLKGISACR
jgi:hypothetical protein